MDKYFDRELSWLSFNYRVLLEAERNSTPLFEKLKFLGIWSSNLDEFFRVRVAEVRSLADVGVGASAKRLIAPAELLGLIHEEVLRQQDAFGRIFRQHVLPALEAQGVALLRDFPADASQQGFIRNYFRREITPVLHPFKLRNDAPPPILQDQGIYHVVHLFRSAGNKDDFAIVPIPTQLPRFLALPPSEKHPFSYIFIDDIIRFNLSEIFPGYEIRSCHSVKMTRDADLNIEDEFSGDLVEKIRSGLRMRKTNAPARFLYDKEMPDAVLKCLTDFFELEADELMPGGRYHNLSDLMKFPNPLGDAFEYPSQPPLDADWNMSERSIFEIIREKDRVLHFPYHSYDPVIRFLNEAADDPDVTAIRTTQYRVATNSEIVKALIKAALNGKKVLVFVELKARFDEALNLHWAGEMKQAGVRIIYSIPGLKVHAKVALVTRKKGRKKRRYAFLSTGNFNEDTAEVYADHGILTADAAVTSELKNLFQYLENRRKSVRFKHLLVAQFGMREKLKALIDREIAHVKDGKKGRIIIKLNGLEDHDMIDKIYEAHRKGVDVDLIIRGVCRIRPGVEGVSEGLKVTRLVGRYLEHARVLYFGNGGDPELYLSSADWMYRNLNYRIEVAFLVKDADIFREIKWMLDKQLEDNKQAAWLDGDLNHNFKEGDEVDAQREIYQYVGRKT